MTFASIIDALPASLGVWLFLPVASLVVFWLARGLARRCGFVDRGDGKLKLQAEPVALLGGIGVLLVWLLGAALVSESGGQLSASLVVAAAAMTALGAVDDLFALSPKIKLAGQLLICGSYFALSGRIDYSVLADLPALSWLVDGFGDSGFIAHLLVFGCLMAASVVIINAVNLLDGMDGTLSVYGISVAGVLAFTGPDSVSMIVICIALFSFLVFNHPPATMYMGDAGSLLVGFLLFDALLQSLTFHSSLPSDQTGTLASLFVLLSIPMCDTALAIFRRLAQGLGPMRGDRGHIHHRLQERASTTRAALFRWAAINLTVVAVATGCRVSGDWRFALLLPVVAVVAIRMEVLGHVEYRVLRQLAGELRWFLRNMLGRVHEEYSASRLALHAESRTIVSPQVVDQKRGLSIVGEETTEPSIPRIVCRDQASYRLAIRFAHMIGQREGELDSVWKIRLIQDLSPARFSVEELALGEPDVLSLDSQSQAGHSDDVALVIDLGVDAIESTEFALRDGRLIELRGPQTATRRWRRDDESLWAERRAA